MAGWTNSSAAAGGRGEFNHHSASRRGANSSARWRERSRGRPPPQQQPHYRYHPVNANAHPSSPPPPPPRRYAPSGPALLELDRLGQGGSSSSSTSTSTRRSQALADHKSPFSAAAAMPPANDNEPDDNASRNAANFECNVCFDMAADPVVTKCGHLFCWECLYQWLHVHSNHRECPVCKGQVAHDAIIPIYGRSGFAASVHTVPPRPSGARVESSRQQHAVPDLHIHDLDLRLDEDDDDPFDLQEIRLGFGRSLRDTFMSFMTDDHVDMEQHYDDYTNVYNSDDFDEVHDYGLLGFPVIASSGGESGSYRGHGHGDNIMEAFFNNTISVHHQPAFGYPGTTHQNRGHRHRGRARPASSSAEHSSSGGMVTGGSGAFYHDTGAGPNITTGSSSRPNGGWTERRGRSNRNSNSAGGRGMQNSMRRGPSYN